MPAIHAENVLIWTERLTPLLTRLLNVRENESFIIYPRDIKASSLSRLLQMYFTVIKRYDITTPLPFDLRDLIVMWSNHVSEPVSDYVLLRSKSSILPPKKDAFIFWSHSRYETFVEEPPRAPRIELVLNKPESSSGTPTFPYEEDLFLAFALLRNRSILTSAIIMTDVKMEQLPDWTRFENVSVVEDSLTSVVIL